jgi:pimeloyl-ACP methyl ester carboxylesterase
MAIAPHSSHNLSPMRFPRFKRRTKLALLVVLAGGYLSLVLSGCIGDRLVLGKNTAAIPTPAAHRQTIHVGRWEVECWVEHSASDKPATDASDPPAGYVIFLVGKEARVEQWIDLVSQDVWRNRNVEIWGMNSPGSGSGPDLGPARLNRVGPAALATYDAVKRLAGDRPIYVQAGSFGTTAALCIAARRPVAGLLLANPPPLRQLILGHYGWWNAWLLALPVSMELPADLDSIANARNCFAPAVFVLSGADTIIPPRYHDLVYNAYAGPKRRIDMPGIGHDGPLSHAASVEQANDVEWLWRQAMGSK